MLEEGRERKREREGGRRNCTATYTHTYTHTYTYTYIHTCTGTWRFMGFAKNGMPVVLVRARLWNPGKYSVNEYVKYVAYFMEQNIKRAAVSGRESSIQNYVRV